MARPAKKKMKVRRQAMIKALLAKKAKMPACWKSMTLPRISYLQNSNKLLTVVLAFLLLAVTPADAADFSVRDVLRNDKIEHWIYIKGNIEEGDAMKFINVFGSRDDINTVWLESDGGVVDDGMAIAKMIKILELDTYAEKNCNSICSIMFLSGWKKMVTKDAEVGIHAAYNQQNGLKSVNANALVAWYLGSLSYPEELVNLWISTNPKKILDLNKGTANRLKLGFTTIKPVKRPL